MREWWERASNSDLTFMAGAITFNVLMTAIPLLLLFAGIAGFVLSARFGFASPQLVEVVLSYLPVVNGEVALGDAVGGALNELMTGRAGFTIIGALILLWISARLVGTLRVVLRGVFGEERGRGIVHGKLFDLYVVGLGGAFFLLNVGVTVLSRTLAARGVRFGLEQRIAEILQSSIGLLVSFGSAWVLFLLIYRYLPARRVPFRVAAVGATFTTTVYEAMKHGFAWFATSVADYSTAYGHLAVAAVLFFWIYYTAVVFILGGQVARVYEDRRKRRMQAIRSSQDGGTHALGGTGAALLAFALLSVPVGISGQSFAPFGGNGGNPGFLNGGEGVVLADQSLERSLTLDHPLVQTDGPYVVVHVAENRVLVMEGTEIVWSAPAGTGVGYTLEGQGREWTFTTPVGMFRVLRKEKDPIWVTPDWWYVQQNIPIPPHNQRAEVAGTLGTSALFLGDGIAIHGTNRPELLIDFIDPEDRRVSHGCIRLTNEAARELYHRVEVGTPVLIF